MRVHQSNFASNPAAATSSAPKNTTNLNYFECAKNNDTFTRRSKSAPLLSRPKYSNSILDIRGKLFQPNGKPFDVTSYLKNKSIPRRIHRLINETSVRSLESRNENMSGSPKSEDGDDDGDDAFSVSQASLNSKQISERRRGLHLQRSMNKSEARERIKLMFRRVLLVCRVKLNMAKYSVDLVPATKKQVSWSEKRHTREAAEVFFSKSFYQKQPMIYSHVPKWAELILKKAPSERTDKEIMQIHSMMQGLAAYDKFTRRIQLAMCRSFKFLRIKYPRVILRKGHIGQAFYFIFSGSVFINIEGLHVKTNEVVHKTVSILQRGDAFGEVALLRNIQRTASVAVKEDVQLLVVDKFVFGNVCSEIFEREMSEKMEFCRHLPLFKHWTEDALNRICLDSQIHEYKTNKIISRNSSDEEEWIYFCMEGQCRVIKALEFAKKPKHSLSFITQRLEEENGYRRWYHSLGAVKESDAGRERSYSTKMEIMNELQISLEQIDLRKIARSHIVDDDYELESRKKKEEKLKKLGEAEEVLFSFGKNYNHLTHCTGEAHYVLIKKHDRRSFLESSSVFEMETTSVKRRKSIELTTLLNEEFSSGRLNSKVAYLSIATMKRGDVFNLREVLQQTGRKLILVSLNAKVLQIKKQTFFKQATKEALVFAKVLALENNYPDDDALYYKFRHMCLWEAEKTSVLQETIATRNLSHLSRNDDLSENTAKKRARSARQISRKLL